jgi:cysteine desulfurase/selenocysteine lyase
MKEQFPILRREINGNKLVYLDNAATTQKPQTVIDAIVDFYTNHNANIHRGVHTLAEESTKMWLDTHRLVASFINARSYEEIVFVRNSTEALNLVVNTFGRQKMNKGDVVAITEMEHHSNIVSWQLLVKDKGIKIEWIPVDKNGELELDYLEFLAKKYDEKLKIVSVVHQSNVLDAKIDFKEIKKITDKVGAVTLLDVAQSIPHSRIDVRELDCDFLVFSGHKIYGPTGSGVLYGKKSLLEALNPFMGGGEMIKNVSKNKSELNDLPWKFEAGTPNLAGGIGLGAALSWFDENIDRVDYEETLADLMSCALSGLKKLPGVSIIGPTNIKERNSLIAFEIDGIHPHDVASLLDERGIAIRAGYHCAQPLHDVLGIGPTCRVSFACYNTVEEVEYFIDSLEQVIDTFR